MNTVPHQNLPQKPQPLLPNDKDLDRPLLVVLAILAFFAALALMSMRSFLAYGQSLDRGNGHDIQYLYQIRKPGRSAGKPC